MNASKYIHVVCLACLAWMQNSLQSQESLGPSSRRTALVISEIMYHPAARTDGKSIEFVEIFNSQLWFEDLSGYRLTGAIDFTFPSGTILPARAFLVVAKNPGDIRTVYGVTNVIGPYSRSLQNRSGTVRLIYRTGAVLLQVNYSDEPPWPAAADGAGHSLVLSRSSFGEGNPEAWTASDRIGGSPGDFDMPRPDPHSSVLINEILVRPNHGGTQFIELYNHSNEPKNISGCFLSDNPLVNKFLIPQGTIIPPGRFIVFEQTQFGFAPDPSGGTLYLKNADQSRIIDAVRYGGQAIGVAYGRSPNGASSFSGLIAPSPGASNRAALIGDIVINEIMYAPISGNSDDEYVELYNQGTNPINLGGWKFTSGIEFTFPSATIVPPGSYMVVARNAVHLRANYSNLNASNTVGDFRKRLSNRGQKLSLAKPEMIVATDAKGAATTNIVYVVADEVTYGTGGRWGKWSHGGGSSLELIDAKSDHQLAANWADSDESAKSAWTTVEARGVLDNGVGAADSLQVLLMGEGECLIDNVEVIGTDGTNRIVNPTFDKDMTGWIAQGSHAQSGLEPASGVDGTSCLRLRSTHRGDTGANKIRTKLASPLTVASTATLRAKARWLRGFPEILLRLHGNYLEAAATLSLPTNLGTPGARNSRAVSNAGPAIYDVKHSPVLPAANQSILITMRASDPDGVSSFLLKYRLDPSPGYTTIPMVDDGTAGDEVAGDGIYSARLPGQANGILAAFQIEATDRAAAIATTRFPADAPARECLVRFGDAAPPGAFGTYRLWMTQATASKWTARPKLSNEPLDATFVYGNERAIYNVGALYSGSPYHSPGYNGPIGSALCNYIFLFPDDDPLLGVTDFKLTAPGNNPGDDETAQREQTAYWIAAQLGLPYNYQRNINLYINGVRRGKMFEDSQIPNSEVLQEWFPDDSDGELYKIAGWFEFDDGLSNFQTTWATLQKFTTTDGANKLARYRWNWQRRGAELSTSNYTNLFNLVEAANTTNDTFTSAVELQLDADQWMRIFAIQHVVGNWDSYGNNNGQNSFAYKPQQGPWQLMIWDLDIVLGLGNYADGPSTSLFKAADPVIIRMNAHPPFRRAYWRALQDAALGPLQDPILTALLDAKYAAFKTNGASVSAPTGIKSFINTRRNYILQQLRSVATDFSITSNRGDDFSTNQNAITLTGSAPIDVKNIRINGVDYPTTWTTVTNWSMRIPLRAGVNTLSAASYGQVGNFLANHTSTINVTSTARDDQTPDHVVINEWMARNSKTLVNPVGGDFSDWFELYNPTLNAIDLSGFSLSDNLSQSIPFVIPTGTMLESQGHLLVWADAKPDQNGVGRDLHANFKLSQESGLIVLFSREGKMVDLVQYGAQTTDVSEGRWPDGHSSPLYFMPIPTPRAANNSELTMRPPKVSASHSGTNGVALTWDAQPGRWYHVQFKNSLSESSWHNLSGDVVATDITASKTDASPQSAARFYRVQTVR